MPDTDTTKKTFGERLINALEYQGITDHKQQIEKIAQACEVKPKTAEKYLQATSCPVFLNNRFTTRFMSLADDLEADVEWLFNGQGFRQKTKLAEVFRSMSEWEQSKFMRMVIRLVNNDAKAVRLGDMCARGQITRQQLFAAM